MLRNGESRGLPKGEEDMTHSSKRTSKKLGRFSLWADERGLSTVEYVIILVLVAVFGIGAWKAFGGTLTKKVDDSAKQLKGM